MYFYSRFLHLGSQFTTCSSHYMVARVDNVERVIILLMVDRSLHACCLIGQTHGVYITNQHYYKLYSCTVLFTQDAQGNCHTTCTVSIGGLRGIKSGFVLYESVKEQVFLLK